MMNLSTVRSFEQTYQKFGEATVGKKWDIWKLPESILLMFLEFVSKERHYMTCIPAYGSNPNELDGKRDE